MKTNNNITRRNFLGRSCAALGYTTLLSSLVNVRAFAAAANHSGRSPDDEYKALVFVLMSGGNDSFNMLIPRGNPEYNEYAATRSNLAIPQSDILSINPLVTDGREFGLHPALPGLQNLFENGKLAFVCNIGTLVEPTTKTDFLDGTVQTPLGLFSHYDQQQQWQSGRPHERTNIGWGGRIADMLQSANGNGQISMNISLNRINVFQYGQEVVPYVINKQGSIGIEGYGQEYFFNSLRTNALDTMLEHDYNDVYKNTYVNTIKTSNDAAIMFQEAVDAVPEFNANFPEYNHLADQLRMVAKTIAARDTLDFSRQVFFVEINSFDHHSELLNAHEERMGQVNDALTYFQAVMDELGVSGQVTTFTVSDFGRTLTSNGNGTDHAWGGNVMVMGGSVNGKNMFGEYPSLDLNNDLILYDRGVVIPTTPTDMYFAELAKWFGISNSDIHTILPNLSNFFDMNSGDLPLGFMNI